MITIFETILALFMIVIQWYKIAIIQFIDDEQRASIDEWNKMKETYLNNKKLEYETKNG
jgi:hypothetical protein